MFLQGGGGGNLQPEDKQASSQKGGRKQDSRGAKAPKKEWQTVKVEESVDTKVRRWRQVMQVTSILTPPTLSSCLLPG